MFLRNERPIFKLRNSSYQHTEDYYNGDKPVSYAWSGECHRVIFCNGS